VIKQKIFEDWTDRLSRNVRNYQSRPRDISEERRSHLYRCGSLKTRWHYEGNSRIWQICERAKNQRWISKQGQVGTLLQTRGMAVTCGAHACSKVTPNSARASPLPSPSRLHDPVRCVVMSLLFTIGAWSAQLRSQPEARPCGEVSMNVPRCTALEQRNAGEDELTSLECCFLLFASMTQGESVNHETLGSEH